MATAEDSQPSQLHRAESTFNFNHTFSRDNPGKLEDFYEVDKTRLGEGSFGTVSKAKCKDSKVIRAVKSMEIKNVKNPQRFEREISIAKQLDHPNVVRLFEVFRDAKKIYIVMELCTGGELFDRIVEDAPNGFDEMQAAKYIRQIVSSLCYLHAHKFAHRDVKPENFLFHSKDKDSQIKIIDFGLACQFEPGKPMSTKAGTAYYVSPEVLKGEYDEKCDIWSAGVISFILLCGYPPFAGDTDPEILKKVREGTFEFKSPEWDPISQGAKNLVTSMLTVDPTLRPAAEHLLASPWLKFKGTPEAAPIANDFVARLQGFRAHSRLKKVALTAIAQQLPDDDIDSIQNIFRTLDKNGDGTLSIQEIKEGMNQQGLNIPQHFEEILKGIDSNGSGQLDYSEFVAATLDHKVFMQRDVLWTAFRTFDLDGDGRITLDELQKVLNTGGVEEAIGAGKIKKMIEEFDANGDGVIDFDEFCEMMTPKKRGRVAGADALPKKKAKLAQQDLDDGNVT